jgi:hypothetical protein
MKNTAASIAVLLALCVASTPIFAQAAETAADPASAGQASEEDIFGQEETVATTTEQTQNAAPRDELLKTAMPWITGSFTGSVGVNGVWNDPWTQFDLFTPDSHGLTNSGTDLTVGFVARPDTDISITGTAKTSYPFTQDIVTDTTTYTVPDFTIWALYSKFNWKDALFFTFGKQPVRWGTGYFFSPADDIFAQTEVDVDNPTAEREGPMALKVQYPIPNSMNNLYLFAVLPATGGAAELLPENIALAAKAEFLFGNTEVAAAGYYQRQQRPRAVLMATTGFGDFNFFGEGLAAFPGTEEEARVTEEAVTWGTFPFSFSSDYSVVDISADTIYCATAGAMYSNADWNFTAVGQYLYNGFGYADITLGDLLQALRDRGFSAPDGEPALSYSGLVSTLAGLGRMGRHYGVLSLMWSSLWDTDLGFSVLAIANLSDGSGFVKPTLSFKCLNYVTLSGSASFTWGGDGAEYTDEPGLLAAFAKGDFDYVTHPTMSLALSVSIGTKSF